MKSRLLSLFLLMLPISIMAEDEYHGNITLRTTYPDKTTHSETPVNINVDGKHMSILIHEYINWATINIYGTGGTAMLDIESATPGDIYQIDMANLPNGNYDITVSTEDDTLNGNFELQ